MGFAGRLSHGLAPASGHTRSFRIITKRWVAPVVDP
jgi:hypothetical protein